MQHAKLKEPARVAVYDFDNTSLDCSSTVRLVFYLLKSSYLSLGTSLKIGFWGLAYKLRLPQNESWVRGQLFKAFAGRPKSRVDLFLAKYYDEVLEKHFRPAAHASMHEYLAQGVDVLMVSASFEPLVQRAMQRHGFTGQVSTRMKVAPDGTYTREVDGLPVEGDEKIVAIERWCNERYGAGQWKIVAAFGDHHSDEAMLACAEKAYAVNPNSLLEKIAKERGWTILDWDAKDAVVPAVSADVSAALPDRGESAASAFAEVDGFELAPMEAWPDVEEISPDEFPPEGVDIAPVQGDAVPAPGPSGTVTYAMPSVRDARGVPVSSRQSGMMADLSGKMPFVAALTGRMPKVAAEPAVEIEAAPAFEPELPIEYEPEFESQAESELEAALEPESSPESASEPKPKHAKKPDASEETKALESDAEPVPAPEPEPEPAPEPELAPMPALESASEPESGPAPELEPAPAKKTAAKKTAAKKTRTTKAKKAAETAPESVPEPENAPVAEPENVPAAEPENVPAAEPEPKPAKKPRTTKKRAPKKKEEAPETSPDPGDVSKLEPAPAAEPEPEPKPAKKPRATKKRAPKKAKAAEAEPTPEAPSEDDGASSAM